MRLRRRSNTNTATAETTYKPKGRADGETKQRLDVGSDGSPVELPLRLEQMTAKLPQATSYPTIQPSLAPRVIRPSVFGNTRDSSNSMELQRSAKVLTLELDRNLDRNLDGQRRNVRIDGFSTVQM